MYCKNCGADNPNGGKFCKQCGSPLSNQNANKPVGNGQGNNGKSPLIPVLIGVLALLLCIVLGLVIFLFVKKSKTADVEDTVTVTNEVSKQTETEPPTTPEPPTGPDIVDPPAPDPEPEPEPEPPIKEFDEIFIYQIAKIMPFSLDHYDYLTLAKEFMIEIYQLEQTGFVSQYLPVIETGEGPAPYELTYESISVGEQAPYKRVKCEDLDNLLFSIYGRDTITGLSGYGRYRDDYDGEYLSEWGSGWIVSFEGVAGTYDDMDVTRDADKYVCSIHYNFEEFGTISDGTITDKWGYDANSIFDYTLLERSIDETAVEINVEADVAQIKDWYYNEGLNEDRIEYAAGENGVPYSRQYCYHNGKLYFAFIVNNGDQYRFYYKYDTGTLIRYIDPSGEIQDYPYIYYVPEDLLDWIEYEK